MYIYIYVYVHNYTCIIMQMYYTSAHRRNQQYICTPQESTIHLHTAGINNTSAHRRNQQYVCTPQESTIHLHPAGINNSPPYKCTRQHCATVNSNPYLSYLSSNFYSAVYNCLLQLHRRSSAYMEPQNSPAVIPNTSALELVTTNFRGKGLSPSTYTCVMLTLLARNGITWLHLSVGVSHTIIINGLLSPFQPNMVIQLYPTTKMCNNSIGILFLEF